MKKIIRLTERDLTRIVKRVIKENENESEDNDDFVDRIISFDFGGPKDYAGLLQVLVDLILDSNNVKEFDMKLKDFNRNNQKDISNLSVSKKSDLDRFINSIRTGYDFK